MKYYNETWDSQDTTLPKSWVPYNYTFVPNSDSASSSSVKENHFHKLQNYDEVVRVMKLFMREISNNKGSVIIYFSY